MASNSALTLVNRILSTTGDYSALASLVGSPAAIADRIIDFLNIALSEVEQVSEWPELREEASFNGTGSAVEFIYVGASDVPPNGIGSVWIVGGDLLYELSGPQFDKVKAQAASGAVPRYFRRGYDSITSKPSVEIYPAPAAGTGNVKVTMYKRATRFVAGDDSATNKTELDDSLLIHGALMHMDAYDGMDRGYAPAYEKMKENAVMANTRNTLRVPLGEYVKWSKKVPGAWQDPVFRDSYMKEHPEYNIV